MTSSFAPWLGKTVTFRLITGESRVPLRGFILVESPDSVRMRIGNGWEINVYKSMIAAVEQDKEPDTRRNLALLTSLGTGSDVSNDTNLN